MSDDENNMRAMQAQAMAQNGDRSTAAYQQAAYQDPDVGIGGLVRREVAAERERCATIAESHGFPELARVIRSGG